MPLQVMHRRKKASKQGKKAAQVSSESDTDGEGDAGVLPSEAYQLLLKVLGATDADRRSTPKRQKIKCTADLRQAASHLQKQQQPGKPGTDISKSEPQEVAAQGAQSTAQSTARQSSGDVQRTGSRKKRGLNKTDDEEFKDAALEAAPSMRRHMDRQLSEADIAAPRSAKLDKDGNPDFAEAWPSGEWLSTGDPLPEVFESLEAAGIRNRLVSLWREAHGIAEGDSDFTSPQQKAFFALARSYKDVLFPAQSYPQRWEEDQLLDVALLHCIDHVVASSQRIKKANDSLKSNPELEVPRDQGFTRPKVLLLLPMRNVALRVVKRLLQLAQRETRADSVQGKEHFLKEFGDEEAAADGVAEARGPADHAALFAGDTDDHFRFGVKITKGAIKLFADFFQSDIIVASPLGLVTKQAEGGEESTDNLDFLSSIEIALLPRCDVLLMQNWSHVVTVFEGLNKLPTDTHGADVMRVYDWCLAGNARLYRQNILLSSFLSPEMNALFARFCCSHAGRAKLRLVHKGVLARSQGQVQQMFERFEGGSPAEEADARFEHFQRRVWPRIRDSGSGGQFIFVPSYFDYVRLRGFLTAESVGFEGLSEYASGSEVARGKRRFTTGKTRVALYTERSHFYHRRKTKGIKDLYVYQLPEHAQYYVELLDMAAAAEGIDAGHTTVTVLFSKLDALRLERVVGSSRARNMMRALTSTFLFC